MTRIKCCGMTCVEDAVLAARLGADAIGLVFTPRSRRCITAGQGGLIARALPPMVGTVALFMDDAVDHVDEVIATVQPHLLQFHGRESDAWCAQFGRPYIKAIAMGEGGDALRQVEAYPGAAGLLLDGHSAGQPGGSGQRFDWSLLPGDLGRPVILAGGLHAGNVTEAIERVRPWAVDVASGIESSPGVKDPDKMRQFIDAVRRASGRASSP